MADAFLKHAWYMAGWADEVQAEYLVRTIIDVPILLFRDAEGRVVALHDRCPHRFAPLSRGKFADGAVQCGYHGLVFDGTGTCIKNSLGGPTPAASKVRSFPVVEQDNILWLWMGDEATADVDLIPTMPCYADEGLKFVFGKLSVEADYQLLTDNLLDLTHAGFLHPAFGGELYAPKNKSESDGLTVYSRYFVQDIPNPEFPEVIWPAHGRNVDLWDDIRWNAPASLYLESGVVLTGRPRSEGLAIPAVHIITPETTGRSHYFWSSGQPKDSPLPDEEFAAILSNAFDNEDRPMIEAAYERMQGEEFWSLQPVLLRDDAAAVRARRILRELIDRERATSAAA